jgi:Zn-dependent peptidase ImmA (M78 family)
MRLDLTSSMGKALAGLSGDRITETQANRFASALLIPRAMMAKLFPRPRYSRLDWVGLREFKLTWKASKAAILYRARQLELISDVQYKTGVITLRRTGEANGERDDNLIPSESPSLLLQALTILAEKKKLFAKEIASALQITPELLKEIVGIDESPIERHGAPLPLQRSRLQLVT